MRCSNSIAQSCLAVLLLAACSTDHQLAGHRFGIRVQDGVSTAVTSNAPKYSVPLFEYEPILALKEDPEQPETMRYRPGSYYLGADGHYYLADGGNSRIMVYDPNGEFVRTFGGKGEGPGEFQGMLLLHLDDGVLSFWDSRLQRATRYATDGNLIEVFGEPEKKTRLRRLYRLPDSGLLRISSGSGEGSVENEKITHQSERAVITDAEGDTLADLQTPRIPWGYRYRYERGGGNRRMAYTGTAQILYVPGRGLLVSTGVDPYVTWYDLKGRPTLRIELEFPPEPVTDQERELVRQRIVESYEQSPSRSEASKKASLDAFQTPAYKAFWDQAYVDSSGYCWLHVPEQYQDQEAAGGPLFRVFSPDGEYLGDSRWPDGVATISGDLMLSYVTDQETLERTPTVFQIIPTVEGLIFP